ncbi:MAG: ubiquinol oxidase subunit II [Coxiellaceae bacterium]|nr:ubiquinol oxidase subunit II [Coxiellaceae bacterium]
MLKLRSLFLMGCLALLTGCQAHFAILDPKGIIAATEKKIFIEAVLLMLIVVIPVVILSVVIPWRYRANNTKATYRPDWAHSNLLEFIWWTIPCVIIFILSVMVWIYTHKLDPYRPIAADKDTVMVEAIALDWKWLFIYPQYHIATVNEVTLPVNKPVRFYIAADAPMNSLEIPRLAGQIYAMTGMQTKLNLVATEVGTYTGLSTNFSGRGFSGMNFKVHVVSSSDFDSWVSTVKKSPKQLTVAAYNQLILPSENNPVEYFSNPEKGLFKNSIIKWMGPMPGMHLGYDPEKTK